MRQVVLDTETTGIGHERGHRVIEIGCVELIDRKLTGKHYHVYINPERLVDEGAFKVHGISNEFLRDKPLFATITDEFLHFVKDAELIIHNAPFDVGFLNSELNHVGHRKKLDAYCTVFDTLVFAKAKHPGQRNSLDALCKRYNVDNTNRTFHGALLDAEILAYVYLAMTGGQGSLFTESESIQTKASSKKINEPLVLSNAVVIKASEDELTLHQSYVDFLVKKSGIDNFS